MRLVEGHTKETLSRSNYIQGTSSVSHVVHGGELDPPC